MESLMVAKRFESTVLNCFDDAEHCLVCRFIAGDRSTETLLHVIDVLDQSLAEEETENRRHLDIIAKLAIHGKSDSRQLDGTT